MAALAGFLLIGSPNASNVSLPYGLSTSFLTPAKGVYACFDHGERLKLLRLATVLKHLAYDAVIHVYDAVGNVIATHEHKGDFKEW